jgi:hypothetical protein
LHFLKRAAAPATQPIASPIPFAIIQNKSGLPVVADFGTNAIPLGSSVAAGQTDQDRHMVQSLTRRVIISAIATAAGSTALPLAVFGQSAGKKKQLPPCEARRIFGNWEAKIWDSLGGITGSIRLVSGAGPAETNRRCWTTDDNPGVYIAWDGAGKANYWITFNCVQSVAPRQFNLSLTGADGKQLRSLLNTELRRNANAGGSEVWASVNQIFAGQGVEQWLNRRERFSLSAEGDAGSLLSFDVDGSAFPDAWQFFAAESARLRSQRDKQCGSDCFITTACCELLALEDDCFELRTLRRFRDDYLLQAPGGRDQVASYYDVAPQILFAMQSTAEIHTLESVYFLSILPCAIFAHFGLNSLARKIYTRMMSELEAKYSGVLPPDVRRFPSFSARRRSPRQD